MDGDLARFPGTTIAEDRAAMSLDLPLGGTLVTGDLGAVVELMLGRPPRQPVRCPERDALHDLRRARGFHTLYIGFAARQPSMARRWRAEAADERQIARGAVERLRLTRVPAKAMGRAGA